MSGRKMQISKNSTEVNREQRGESDLLHFYLRGAGSALYRHLELPLAGGSGSLHTPLLYFFRTLLLDNPYFN
jgi:hypothetical protein